MRIGGIFVADRDKVIRRLEQFINNYKRYITDWEPVTDALALLKGQEARVMSVEEIAERAACLDPDPIFVQWETGATAWIASAIDTIAAAAKAGNRNFRAWTSRPTPEQMRETKWDAD